VILDPAGSGSQSGSGAPLALVWILGPCYGALEMGLAEINDTKEYGDGPP